MLDLLWVLEHTVARLPIAAALFERVLAGEIFKASDLPTPTKAERPGPKSKGEVSNAKLPGIEEDARDEPTNDDI